MKDKVNTLTNTMLYYQKQRMNDSSQKQQDHVVINNNKSPLSCAFNNKLIQDIKLIGIITDPHKAWAIVADAAGNSVNLTVGDCISQAHYAVTQINDHALTLNTMHDNLILNIG